MKYAQNINRKKHPRPLIDQWEHGVEIPTNELYQLYTEEELNAVHVKSIDELIREMYQSRKLSIEALPEHLEEWCTGHYGKFLEEWAYMVEGKKFTMLFKTKAHAEEFMIVAKLLQG